MKYTRTSLKNKIIQYFIILKSLTSLMSKANNPCSKFKNKIFIETKVAAIKPDCRQASLQGLNHFIDN